MRLPTVGLVALLMVLLGPACAAHYASARLLPSTEEESLIVFREYNARLEQLASLKQRATLQLKDVDESIAKTPRGEAVPASFVQQREQYQGLVDTAEKELKKLGAP